LGDCQEPCIILGREAHMTDIPSSKRPAGAEGWQGWDDYAPFYDWENARTMGRQDVRFWQDLARREGGPVLELGSGTGRLTIPVSRTGVRVVGVDRSRGMLAFARRRARRLPAAGRPRFALGDIRALPFAARTFQALMAPYGMLQSLTSDADLEATLAGARRVLVPGGVLGVDLVPDLPAWDEYDRRIRFRGTSRAGARVTLIESVRQDRRRGLTVFDQEYVEHRGRQTATHRFSLTFRTLPLAEMLARIETAGFEVTALLGDYRGRAWDIRADVWLILASKRR